MSYHSSCSCKNIEVIWHTTDYRFAPRACQCEYCRSKSAAYVSLPRTKFEATIRRSELHNTVQHGSNSAAFHECTNCNQVIFVTAEIGGELYGALNANHLYHKPGLAAPIKADFSNQSANEKLERWKKNWCHPVLITSQARGAL